MSFHIFGDSHARACFAGMPNSVNHAANSMTMHRVGRDGLNAVNCKANGVVDGNTVFWVFGEIDCRCHVQRQVDLGREYENVMKELVENYFRTIRQNDIQFEKLKHVIVSVVPPVRMEDFYRVNPPLPAEHPFPFVGSDERRVEITKDMNRRLETKAREHEYRFLDINTHYTRDDGTLKFELSDGICHVRDNAFILSISKHVLDELDIKVQ